MGENKLDDAIKLLREYCGNIPLSNAIINTTENDRNPHYDETYKLAENERFGKKSESYYILNNGEEWECNKAIWDCAELGGTIEIRHFRFGKTILKMEVK